LRNVLPAALVTALITSTSMLGIAYGDPAGGPSAIVTPNTDLIDGDIVQVSGDGFKPAQGIAIVLCSPVISEVLEWGFVIDVEPAPICTEAVALNANADGTFAPADVIVGSTIVGLLVQERDTGPKDPEDRKPNGGHLGGGGEADGLQLAAELSFPAAYDCRSGGCYIRVISTTKSTQWVDVPVSFGNGP